MRLRSLLLFGAGIAIGYQLSSRLREDDSAVVHGPRDASRHRGLEGLPGMRTAASGAQRLADEATVKSLDAIRWARGAIRDRLGENDDLAAWS